MDATERVTELAAELGFDLVGAAPVAPPPHGEHLRAWLERGLHGGLEWMAESAPRLLDPRRLLPGARGLLMVGFAHSRAPVHLAGGGRVARYAAGRDYHNVLGKRLRRLRRRLREAGLLGASRQVVDAGPLMERSHGAAAGLGFASKGAHLIHHRLGPWFFLGGVLMDLELTPAPTPAPGSCGTCRACIDACPTAAILEPGVVDAGRCISYHTIENPGTAPVELRPQFGEWVFGCDVCSEVCPFGAKAPDVSERFGTHPKVAEGRLLDWLSAAPRDGEAELVGSPLMRATRGGLARNAAIALGNLGRANRAPDGAAEGLLSALERDPEARVRESALWALVYGFSAHPAARRAELALERPADPAERARLRESYRAAGG